MSSFANRLTQGLEPYTPGEQPKEPGLIKLNTNENPFGPGPKVREAIASFPLEALRLYPDPESVQLRSKLAEEAGLSLEQVFVGNGSDEILAFIFQTFFEAKGEPLLFPKKLIASTKSMPNATEFPASRCRWMPTSKSTLRPLTAPRKQ